MIKKPEFSKLVLGAAVLTWFAGAVYGAVIVNEEHTQLGELLAYIGAPAATAFGFYYWKAKAENVIKIPAFLKNNGMSKKAEKQLDESVEKAIISGIAGVLKDILHNESDTDEEV